MSKYMIEIEDVPFSKVRIDVDNGAQNINLYRAKGFNSLVFDQFGLDKLTPLDKALSSELGEAYHKGFESGSHEATTLEYQQGLEDMHEAIKKIYNMSVEDKDAVFDTQTLYYIVNNYTANEIMKKLATYEQQKADAEIKVGDIITDGKINYLVIDITDKSYVALQGTDFEPVYIGKDYIKSYNK